MKRYERERGCPPHDVGGARGRAMGNCEISELGNRVAGDGVRQGAQHRGGAGDFGRDPPFSLPCSLVKGM